MKITQIFAHPKFLAVVQLAAALAVITAHHTSVHVLVPIALGLGAAAAFSFSLQAPGWRKSVAYTCFFGLLGYIASLAHGFSNLKANQAWYALAASIFAYKVWSDWQKYDRGVVAWLRLRDVVRWSSILAVCFVPLSYGTGWRPTLGTVLYLGLVNTWLAFERRSDNRKTNIEVELLIVASLVLFVLVAFLHHSVIATALIGSAIVIAATLAANNDAEKLYQGYAPIRA